jgi:hypothetical protein
LCATIPDISFVTNILLNRLWLYSLKPFYHLI